MQEVLYIQMEFCTRTLHEVINQVWTFPTAPSTSFRDPVTFAMAFPLDDTHHFVLMAILGWWT